MSVGVVAVLVGILVWSSRSKDLDCATAVRETTPAIAVGVCQREYEQTRRPATGALLANVSRISGNLQAAMALANELLVTEARADAHYVLGKIAVKQERLDDAFHEFEEARKQHRAEGRRMELAKDDQAFAELQTKREQYAEALQTLDECIAEARIASDTRIEGFCHLSAATVLIRVGYFEAAEQEIDRAEPAFSLDRDRAQVWYERGNFAQELVRSPLRRGQNQRAIQAFEQALQLATRAQLTEWLITIRLNLAFSYAESLRFDVAERYLAEAGVLDRDKQFENHRAQLAARIAYRRGNLGLAARVNERLYPEIKDDDDRMVVAVMQARIALASNDLVDAERWARQAVEIAEKMRAAQTVTELRPWVLASRREPFEVRFKALALAGRIEDAIVVFDQWQGRTLLDAMVQPNPDPTQGLSSTASKIQGLGRWLPAASNAPLMKGEGRAVLDTLRKIDLVALAVVDGEIWRLAGSRGRIRLEDRGSLEDLRDRLDRFKANPTDRALADALGALLLPDDVVRDTDDPLYVVLDAELATLPFVALRRNDRALISARPVLRAPRLPTASSCAPRTGVSHGLILADAAGDLPSARKEASYIASLFKTTPLVGSDATSTALLAAKPDWFLHFAVHADFDAGGGFLKLYDRALSAPEISANRLGASLVMLSACSTVQSNDPELSRSLATAFLAGGSSRVVATVRPITDAGASEITRRFYEAGGVTDPVRVLARIQADLAAGGTNKDWPNFAAFGNEVCTGGS